MTTRSVTPERTSFRTAVAEESPDVARRVVGKLKECRALRASGTLLALDGGFDVA